jgi:hypothetical protein
MLIAILLLAIVLSACIASNAQQPELSSFSKLSEIIARWRARRGAVACGVNSKYSFTIRVSIAFSLETVAS